MNITEDVVVLYEKFRKKINSIKNLDVLFPKEKDQMEEILGWTLNLIQEPYDMYIDMMFNYNAIILTEEERNKIYPLVIAFVKFLKSKFS